MPEYDVNVVITKSYRLTVKAKSEDKAIKAVENMQSTEIAEKGSLKNVEVDNIEIAGKG